MFNEFPCMLRCMYSMYVSQVTYNFKFCINLQWLTKRKKIQMFKTTARITEEGSKEKLIINEKL